MRVTHISEAVPMRVVLTLRSPFLWRLPVRPVADNPYAVAGISNPAHVTQFLARLKQAMAADDHAAVAAMVKYPLTVDLSPGAAYYLP